MTLNKGNQHPKKKTPEGRVCGTTAKRPLSEQTGAAFDFLEVWWDPNTGNNPFLQKKVKREDFGGSLFGAWLSSDTWLALTGCHRRWARPQDRHKQEDDAWELSQVLTTYSTRWRPWESRWPSFPRTLGVPRHQDHSCLCSQGLCHLNSCLGRKWPKWGESMRVWKPKLWCRPSKAKPSVKGSEQSDLFQT